MTNIILIAFSAIVLVGSYVAYQLGKAAEDLENERQESELE